MWGRIKSTVHLIPHLYSNSIIIALLTNTSFLVSFLPAFFALLAVLIGCSRTCFAGRVTFCKKRSKPNFKLALHLQVLEKADGLKSHLCRERRCHFSLRWSGRRCSPGRTPLCNCGYSCTFRYLPESRLHRTPHFRDKASRTLPHKLRSQTNQNFMSYKFISLHKSKTRNDVQWQTHSQLQSRPNVPFGQQTLMVSTQNHLCRSGCFVFLHRDNRYCYSCVSRVWSHPATTTVPNRYMHVTVTHHTSWTTKFQNALRVLLPCGCTRSCCYHTDPPRSPQAGSRCKTNKPGVLNRYIFPTASGSAW